MGQWVSDGEPFPAGDHDHARCVVGAVAAAAALCNARGARLTELRRRVLEIVWASHSPVGAYDILELLRRERRRAAPPTVYRTLEFLCEHRLVHRIDTLNAFVGCTFPGAPHRPYFLLCSHCGTAAEIDDRELGRAVGRLKGLCPHCRSG
jgi:Fur family zinc uptake transcriptional regulator